MIVNPYTEPHRVLPYQGTRMLPDDFGLTRVHIRDPKDSYREWMIHTLYAPIPGRALGGVRAKLVDSKGFITFCNQRDLEVLLGFAKPGGWCAWAGEDYVSYEDKDWFGLCADEEDLRDDLQERELVLRGQYQGGVLPPDIEFTRWVHLEPKMDFEELYILLRDYDPETGFFPDMRFETLESRWVRSQRERLRWDRI